MEKSNKKLKLKKRNKPLSVRGPFMTADSINPESDSRRS